MFRRLTLAQLLTDIGIAAALVLLRSAVIGYDNSAMPLVVLGMGLALAIRRISPGLALIVAWLFAVGQMLAQQPPDISNIAILAVLFSTARYGGGWVKWAGLSSALAGAFIATVYVVLTPYVGVTGGGIVSVEAILGNFYGLLTSTVIILIGSLAVLGLSWTAGLLVRTRATARDSRRDQLLAEQSVAVEQERNRIARDMHDVVAHSLAVVIAQADGARYARESDPSSVDAALTTISSTAREALADVRILLGQLRHSQDAGPQPSLVDLERLVDQLRASGLLVSLRQSGDPLSIPAGRQLALYRIVQEGLTNALRHGDIEHEVVAAIDWSADAASLTITNAVAEPSRVDHVGHGLVGMRERALLAGGTFSAGPEGSDFVVRASIPVLVAS